MFGLGATELLIVLALVLLLFGARKLPQLGRGIGEGIRNFKSGLKGGDSERQMDPSAGSETSARE